MQKFKMMKFIFLNLLLNFLYYFFFHLTKRGLLSLLKEEFFIEKSLPCISELTKRVKWFFTATLEVH